MLRLRPQKPRRKDGPVTVCISAACESGRQVVCATDGLLSYAGITADVMLAKIYFINEWLFMYAGEPSQAKLILEEIYFVREKMTVPLDRKNIQKIVSRAYERRMGRISSAPILGPLNIELEEFTDKGVEKFGEKEFGRLAQAVQNEAQNFREQLLVIGWGMTGASCMIYEVGPNGDADHALDGVAAIGSGAEVALSTMLMLGQSRNSMLPETLYAVAAAKFSAEKSHGQDVGPQTAMYVCEKSKDGALPRSGNWVEQDEVNRLRKLWEQYGRPRIPDEAQRELVAITNAIGYDAHVRPDLVVSTINSAIKRSDARKSKGRR